MLFKFNDNYSNFYSCPDISEFYDNLPVKSLGSLPKFSPLMVTLVPGGPSLGDTPVTNGAAILSSRRVPQNCKRFCLYLTFLENN